MVLLFHYVASDERSRGSPSNVEIAARQYIPHMDTPPPLPPLSHHLPKGGFRNPWPGEQVRGFRDLIRWRLGDRRRHDLVPTPAFDSLPRVAPSVVTPRAARGYRSATWIGHSTVLLQIGPLNVLTDPIWSERASPLQWIGPRRFTSPGLAFDALPDIDLVLISHNHYDHLDKGSVERLAARFPNASWLCPLRLAPRLRAFGAQNVIERDWGQSIDTPVFSATCTAARHFSARGLGDRNHTLWCGWTLESDGARIYFAGDTALHPDFDQIGRLGPFDLVMLPIGAYEPRWFMRSVHMNPEDAVVAYQAVANATHSAPPCLTLHWGAFRLTDEAVDEPPAQFALAWTDAGLPAELNWTFALGETRRF
jgi:N-acyl-phosphatidylethanolamine-hydrolysing phospholipase D